MSTKSNRKEKNKPMVATIVRLRPEVRAQLEKMALQHRMTLSAFLRWMAEERVCYENAA